MKFLILLKFFKMELKSTYKDIVWFSLKEDILINLKGNITEINGLEIGQIEDARKLFRTNSGQVIIQNSLNRAFYLTSGNSFLPNQHISKVTKKYYLTYSKNPRNYSIFDKQNSNCLVTKDTSFGDVVFNNLIFSFNLGIIKFYDIEKDIFSFKYNLNKLEENQVSVGEFSGIYNNILVCALDNGGILGIDIEKEELTFYFKEAQIRSGLYQKAEGSPVFIGLKHWTYIELDVETGEILKKVDLRPQLKMLANIPEESPCWLSINTTKYQDNLIYFFADKNCVGIFDTKSTKIIDSYWFDFKENKTTLKSGSNSLQVRNGEIYCLDTDNKLHVLDTNVILN